MMDAWIDGWMYAYNYECMHTCVCVCAQTYNYESMHRYVCAYMHEFAGNRIYIIGMFARLGGGVGITTFNMALRILRVFTV